MRYLLLASVLIVASCSMDLKGLGDEELKLELKGSPTYRQQMNENGRVLF